MNQFGRIFSISIFGESHGPQVGVVVDGVLPGMSLDANDFIADLDRRKAGSEGTTSRKETDTPQIVSGLFNGKTTGAPLTIIFQNSDVRSADYEQQKSIPRPGHADFVAGIKFNGYQDYRGGGHFSGRLTVALVAAGVVAKKQLSAFLPDININAVLTQAGNNADVKQAIADAIKDQDSIGGIITCSVNHLPIGLGEPFFDSVESVISHLIFSIPAVKGIEFGSGFKAAAMKGSQHNDVMIDDKGTLATNHSGGVSGGITNGNDLIFNVSIKPTSSTPKSQTSFNTNTKTMDTFQVKGRHDLCLALRATVVVESATALALVDLVMINQSKKI